jgi:TIR domain
VARIERTIFISYRRTDVYTAMAVYQDLSSKGYDVFFDYTSISSGDFEQIIINNIKARAHFILILTPTALDRCDEPGDWLRREIETAIDEQRNIVPLFFKGFNFSTPSISEKLTGKLSGLSRYNGLKVHEDYFHAAMDRLREQFLKVPLDAVLHPLSTEAKKAVKQEQSIVNQVLAEKWQNLQELFKSAEEKTVETKQDKTEGSNVPVFVSRNSKSLIFRLYGIGAGILLLVVLGWAGINAWANRRNEISTPTMTSQAVADTPTTKPSLTAPVSTSPGFVQADYVNIVHPCPETWWVRVSLTNKFNSALKSMSISVKDTATGDISSESDEHLVFVDLDQSICEPDINVGNDTYIDDLAPNQSFTVSSGVFRKDPTEHPMEATLTLCTEEGLGGQCSTKTINFTPSITLQPTSPYIILSTAINCRSGPGTQYDIIGVYAADTKIPVLGKDPSGKYWLVESPYRNDKYPKCWLPSTYIKEFGNLDNVAIYPVPPTPTLTSPTATP